MKESAVVLLIEESIDELYAFEKGLRAGGIRNPVRIVRYASEALCYLQGVGVYEDRTTYPLPKLILLDLQLKPRDSALQLLTAFRRQPHLRDIPVLALGRADTPQGDIQEAFNLGANGYFSKEQELSDIIRVLKDLYLMDEMWQRY